MCMCMLNKRVHVLLDNELWQQLFSLAKRQNTSIGELTRKALKKIYFSEDIHEKRKRALENILKIRKVSKKPIDYKALINYGRKF